MRNNKKINVLYTPSDNYAASGAFLQMVDMIKELKDKYYVNPLIVLPDNEGNRVLVVYAETRHTKPTPLKKIVTLVNKANKVYQNKIDLLYLRSNPNLKPNQYESIINEEHLKIYDYLGTQANNHTLYVKKEEKIINQTIFSLLAFAKINKK
ncbi:MAG: hypothetical protein PHE89_07360 [Alphaproteobacteria bacterium]|nr:hypothetical protein [Alphaproteobacteria bacterium]